MRGPVNGMTVRALLLLMAVALCASAASADYEDGERAYVRKDFRTAFAEWMPLATRGDAEAQYGIGVLYDNGEGVPQDFTAAALWYGRAAEQDHHRAQNNLGILYENGRGVDQDLRRAARDRKR